MHTINRYLILSFLILLMGSMQLKATNLIINGHVHNLQGKPLQGHLVNLVIDGDTSIHVNNLKTNSSGFYSDTVQTPDSTGIILAYTYDCENNYKEEIIQFAGNETNRINFNICENPQNTCETNFYFIKDSLNNLKYHYKDNTVSNSSIITYSWDFGDSTTSMLKNPAHTYNDTGEYIVNLKTWTADGCVSQHTDSIYISADTVSCMANYYFKKDTTSGLMNYYHFYDNSSPSDQIASYYWDFDDGDTAKTENPSHQFKNKGTYNVKLTITTQSGCTSTYSHRIVIENDQVSSCNAAFGYIVFSTNKKKYHFSNTSQSIGSSIVGYYWDFGDGNYSTKENPTHLFPKIGEYKVSLTIVTQDSCVSTSKQTITVGNPSYHTLGGQVLFNNQPIDVFDAILYQDINNYLKPIDTLKFDTLGYFYFVNVAQGDYKVKIYPTKNSAYYLNTSPSYYQNDLLWNNSKSVNLNSSKFNNDVDMMKYNSNTGNGKIFGHMFYDKSTSMNYPPNFDDTHNKEIYLINTNTGIPIEYTYTDSIGNFMMDNLPYGQYKIVADYPGKYSKPIFVTLSQNNPVIDSVLLKVSEKDITGVIKDKQQEKSTIGEGYPNPADHFFTLPVNLLKSAKLNVSFRSVTGQMIRYNNYEFTSGKDKINFDVSNVEAGVYILEIKSPDIEVYKQQKIIIY